MFSSLLYYYQYFLFLINVFIVPHSILILGDSEAGIASHHISHVQQANETIYFEYKVGSIIEYWFGDNLDRALQKHPDIDTIIIFLGTNNINRKYLHLSPILNKINKYHCIWVSPAKVKGYHRQSTKDLQTEVNSSSCYFFNSENLNLTLYDGFHPTNPSMDFWLENIWSLKMKLSPQEIKIIAYLQNKDKVAFEELAQFSKDPTKVKLKSIQKIISDLKKKHKDNNVELPFTCNFYSLVQPNPPKTTIIHNDQKLFKVERKKSQETVITDAPIPMHTDASVSLNKKSAHIDFTINKDSCQVLSKSGWHQLNEDDFQVFYYFYNNVEKIITLEELRDKVCFSFIWF